MCLLDHVVHWDSQRIQCRASSHRNKDNPLRSHDQLGTACGIEYAAQAMAVHGALLAPADASRPRAGYLVSVRGTTLHVPRLDDICADLDIEATCISGSSAHIQRLLIADQRRLNAALREVLFRSAPSARR